MTLQTFIKNTKWPRDLLFIIAMYCPEGPFLWESANRKAFSIYYTWEPTELATLFHRNAEWILGDFVPYVHLKKVVTLLNKRIVFDSGVALMILNSKFSYSDGANCNVFLDENVTKYYISTLTAKKQKNFFILNALELHSSSDHLEILSHEEEWTQFRVENPHVSWNSKQTKKQRQQKQKQKKKMNKKVFNE